MFSFKTRPLFGRYSLSREANMKSQKSSPFVEMTENHGVVPKIFCLQFALPLLHILAPDFRFL